MESANDVILYRLTEAEKKVEIIDGKLSKAIINLEVMKTELSHATGKQSTWISSIVSVIIGVVLFGIQKLFVPGG